MARIYREREEMRDGSVSQKNEKSETNEQLLRRKLDKVQNTTQTSFETWRTWLIQMKSLEEL